ETIALLGPNDFFGEMALINEKPRNASVLTLCECEMYSINPQDLKEIILKKPEISEQIAQEFIRRSKINEQS
nr:cyclic nucleotide-binding domain-containing protein [Candidatus Gracilibacteria bacterium]